jgi:hypothetical protein
MHTSPRIVRLSAMRNTLLLASYKQVRQPFRRHEAMLTASRAQHTTTYCIREISHDQYIGMHIGMAPIMMAPLLRLLRAAVADHEDALCQVARACHSTVQRSQSSTPISGIGSLTADVHL